MHWALSARMKPRGFTLVELLVAIAIIGLVLAVSVPFSARFYESMQYRQAVKGLVTTLSFARQSAITSGVVADVMINPETREIVCGDRNTQLPDKLKVAVSTAGELNREQAGVIRFYPEGGSSGGDIDLEMTNGRGVRISVDWLMGGVSQARYEFD